MSVLDRPLAVHHAAAAAGRVVVLGGEGFVGTAIVHALGKAGFLEVSATRHTLAGPPTHDRCQCDATDCGSVLRALEGAFAVVNAVRGNARVMVLAARAVAEAARRQGIGHVVHISSMAVYGAASGQVSEDAPLAGTSLYARAKIAGESAFLGTGAVVLRPGQVYGPGGEEWVGRLGRLLAARRLGDLGQAGDGFCNLVLSSDLGAAVVASLRRPAAEGETLNIGMRAPPRWNEFLVALARAIGAVPACRIPGWRLSLEGCSSRPLALGRHLACWLGQTPNARLPEPISPALLRLFRQDVVLNCDRADRLLGYPRTPMAAGLAESAAWFCRVHGVARR